MRKSFSLLIVCGSAILSSGSVMILIYKTGFVFSMTIFSSLLAFVILLTKYNSYRRIKEIALSNNDLEIINSNDQKNIFISDRINTDPHDFQRRIATEDRA